jgi:hypothetical protein
MRLLDGTHQEGRRLDRLEGFVSRRGPDRQLRLDLRPRHRRALKAEVEKGPPGVVPDELGAKGEELSRSDEGGAALVEVDHRIAGSACHVVSFTVTPSQPERVDE